MGLLSQPIDVIQSQGRNDCGPCATTMVLNYFGHEKLSVSDIAAEMISSRLPRIGATLPWGIGQTLQKHGLETVGGWFGSLDAIKAHIDADHPVIVLVRPTDLQGVPFFSLHYRVVVGYNDDKAGISGGGTLFFSCSAYPIVPQANHHPGNLSLSYAQFSRQWLTWVSINWYIAAYPRKAGLG